MITLFDLIRPATTERTAENRAGQGTSGDAKPVIILPKDKLAAPQRATRAAPEVLDAAPAAGWKETVH
jgi:hypothetical protein